MEKYKDETGKLKLSATMHEINILVAYQAWLDKHKDGLAFAFDAFKAGAEYARQPYGWISVKERLPEEIRDMVFCCRRDGSIMLVDLCEGVGVFDSFPDIEYWMPYPLPPVELQKPVRIICDELEVQVLLERLKSEKRKGTDDGDKNK